MTTGVTISPIYNNLTSGNQPASLLDGSFAQLAGLINSISQYTPVFVDSGAVNSIVVSIPGPLTYTYSDGVTIAVKIAVTNTGPTVANIAGQGSVSVVNQDGTALVAGQLAANKFALLVYSTTLGKLVLYTDARFPGSVTIADSQLSANVPLLNASNVFALSTNAAFRQQFNNVNTGTGAQSDIRFLNNADALYVGITGTGFSGTVFTGGPSTEHAYVGNTGSVPLSIASGGTERIRIAGDGSAINLKATAVQSNGTEVAKALSGSATFDFSSISANSLATTTMTVTGASVGDPVAFGTTLGAVNGLIPYAQVSSADTVSYGWYNVTAGAIDPASATYKVRVFK